MPVDVAVAGKRFRFQPGDLLVEARLSGTALGQVPAGARVMCGEPHVDLAKSLLAASTLGMSIVLNRTGVNAQLCLIDGDRDGRMEQAILVGVKNARDAVPVAIAPAAYTALANQPMAGESRARIVYRGKTGLTGGTSASTWRW